MLRLMLMELLAQAMPGAWYASAGPNSAYPKSVYAFVDPSTTADARSFDTDTETFTVQLSAFDDVNGGSRLLEALQDLRESLEAMADTNVVSITHSGGTGPIYIDSEREWRVTADYVIVMAKAKAGS